MGFWANVGKAAQGVAGGGSSPGMSMWGAERANRQNIQGAEKQMQFQDRMSSSMHTREVRDLRNAGLNPILSAGGGASAPGGAMPMIKSITEGASSSAQGAVRLMADLKILKATARRAGAEAGISEAAEFSAKNKMEFEKKHPKKFGMIDAIMTRLGVGSRAVGAARGAVAPPLGSHKMKKRRRRD